MHNIRKRTSAATVSVLAGLMLLGCTAEQKRDLDGAAIKATTQDAVENALDGQGIELDGDLSCKADVADDSSVTGSCDGKDASGTPVSATLTGTADIDQATCTGQLVVTRGSETLLDDPNFKCLGD